MGDALDILNVQRPAGVKTKAPVLVSKTKKQDGVHREVAGLVGKDAAQNVLPSIVPTFSFKEKRNRDKPVRWEWKAFSNSARTDGVMFYHWQKERVQWDDYPFARFNKQVSILQYTDKEYEQNFSSDEWTKEETDTLMSMCKQYDLRFIVIHDRFPNLSRTVEDLKARFYGIQLRLAEIAGQTAEENPIFLHTYNKDYEVDRKLHLDRLYARDRTVERDEQILLEEAKKIQIIQKRREKERKQALELSKQAVKKNSEKSLSAMTEDILKKTGCCLRSDLMHCTMDVSAKTQNKIATILDALGLSKPLASEGTMFSFAALRHSLRSLLEWQRYLQKKKFEYDTLKKKKLEILKPPKPKRPATSSETSHHKKSKK